MHHHPNDHVGMGQYGGGAAGRWQSLHAPAARSVNDDAPADIDLVETHCRPVSCTITDSPSFPAARRRAPKNATPD